MTCFYNATVFTKYELKVFLKTKFGKNSHLSILFCGTQRNSDINYIPALHTKEQQNIGH